VTATIAPTDRATDRAAAVPGGTAGDPYDNQFTRRFGRPAERPRTKIKPALTEDVKAFIRASPFLIMATADAQGRCDASPKGGQPGFAAILDDTHLLVPDVAGNKLFQGYRNMVENPHVGLLFMIPGNDRTVRVNGRVALVDREDVQRRHASFGVHNPDDNTITLQGIVVEVEEAYGHCPRAFKFADLWNVGAINAGGEANDRKDR
jgi:PPOX class probable FMN-dependent enzyme